MTIHYKKGIDIDANMQSNASTLMHVAFKTPFSPLPHLNPCHRGGGGDS